MCYDIIQRHDTDFKPVSNVGTEVAEKNRSGSGGIFKADFSPVILQTDTLNKKVRGEDDI